MENEDRFKKIISSFAKRFPNPDEFISGIDSVIERLSIPGNEKGHYFLYVGLLLYNLSNYKMALPVWERSLTYFIKNKDVSGESICYTSLGSTYQILRDFKKAMKNPAASRRVSIAI